MTPEQAIALVRQHGVVLASAKGPVLNLAEAIVGAPIRGSWWAHRQGKAIYAILQAVETAPDILVCRAVNGRISFVHRRLWPALIRLADRFPAGHLAQIHQEHTSAGRHLNHMVAFPDWAPPEARAEAEQLTELDALAALGDWAPRALEIET
jgi:hypothetical protein